MIEDFLAEFRKIDLDEAVAKKAGKIRLDLKKPFADAAIAATCLEYDLILVTTNEKHFRQIKGLKLVVPDYKDK